MAEKKQYGMSYARLIGWFVFMALTDRYISNGAPEHRRVTFAILAFCCALFWLTEWMWHLLTKRYAVRIVRRDAEAR